MVSGAYAGYFAELWRRILDGEAIMLSNLHKCAALQLVVLSSALAFSDDWPQWRGPHRDGVIPSSSSPSVWPERLKLRWKIKVGEGHASPIFANGKVYVFSRQQGKEVSSSVDPDNGRILWQQSYAAPYTMNPVATRHGEGPKSTPVFHGGKLYTFGISGMLTCWDAASG